MQRQPRLSRAEWDALTTWRPPGPLYSTWPAHKPLTDRSPWWRNMVGASRPLVRTHTLSVDRRERFIDAAVAAARACESPFNAEGPMRALVRSELCLMRWPWREADAESGDIFEEALHRCGVRARPSWEEAQAAYTQYGEDYIERRRCEHCGEPRRGRCCAKARHAAAVASKYKACPTCGRLFRRRPALDAVHCSVACMAAAKRAPDALVERPCEHCGATFRLPKPSSPIRFCSISCGQRARRAGAEPIARTCPICATIFRVPYKSTPKQLCSRRCADLYRSRGTHARAPAAPAEDDQERERRCA